jgi:RNA polymerase sigma-70 factor (ECF subfamily)
MTVGPAHSLGSMAEAVVVELARAGDLDAFQELVRRRETSVRNLMRRLCGNTSHAEDLSQEVFVQAWHGIRALKSNAAFWSWVRQIAVRTWMRAQMQQRETYRIEQIAGDAAEDQAIQSRTAVQLDLDDALSQLEPAVRLCIALSYQVGMSHGEIATVTAMPIGTVKSHILRGTKLLRGFLIAYAERGRQE